MSCEHATIGIERADLIQVRDCVKSLFSVEYTNESIFFMGIWMTISDYADVFNFADEYMRKNGLEETGSFREYIDMNLFNIQIDFETKLDFKFIEIVPPIANLLGLHLSSLLKKKVFIAFDNAEIMFRIYDKGDLVLDNENIYKNYFSNKFWVPMPRLH